MSAEFKSSEIFGLLPDGSLLPVENHNKIRQLAAPVGLSVLTGVGILTGANQQNRVSAQEPTMIPESTVCAQIETPVFDKDGNFLWWPNSCVPDEYKRAPYPTDPPKPDATVCAQAITYAKNPVTGKIEQFPTRCDVPENYEIVQPENTVIDIGEKRFQIFIPSVNKNAQPEDPRVGPRPGQPGPVYPLR